MCYSKRLGFAMAALPRPELAFATPRKLPKPSALKGRVVVLDLGLTSDVLRFHDLLEHSDVLVTSEVELAPDLDARDVARRHPHLVVGALTPFGLDGPYADWVATSATLS